MIIFVVAVHDPKQIPRCPSQQCTRSMVHEHMETQTIEGHGTQNTMSLDDYDTPIVNFMNGKKHKSKKN
jgi:serine protease inhibitor ecotin